MFPEIDDLPLLREIDDRPCVAAEDRPNSTSGFNP